MLSFECIKNEKSVYFLLTSAFSKNVEFLADEAILWPISRMKACFGEEKQELGWGYFHIGP